MRFQNLCRAIGLFILCLATPSAFPQSLMYTFVHLGFSYGQGLGMNRWGDVVGDNYSNSTAFMYARGVVSTIAPAPSSAYGFNDFFQVALYSNNQAYIYRQGSPLTPIGTLGGWVSVPLAINNSGTVVGESTTPDGQYHPFVYTSGGQITDLGTLGGPTPTCGALAINNPGAIVGSCYTAARFTRAFRVVNGRVADFDRNNTLYDSQALGINDSGDAVGWSNKAFLCLPRSPSCRGSVQDAVIFKNNGTITSIGTLGGSSATAYSINSSGDIVGDSQLASGSTHAFLYTHGVMHDLNSINLANGAGWTLITAAAININGQIAGLGVGPSGRTEIVVLTPVPVLPAQLTINPAAVVGTFSTTGTITLSRPAPPGGVVVQLASLNSAAQLPSGNSVTVPENATSATFPITTSVVFQQTQATISASYNGITLNSILTIYNYGL